MKENSGVGIGLGTLIFLIFLNIIGLGRYLV
jgi:hypothetical protein